MQRRIVDYALDSGGDRIAILDCGHPQHIRHNPPFINREWTLTQDGRNSMLGQALNCVRCDEEQEAGETWYALALGDGLMAESRVSEIEEEFLRAFAAARESPEMAAFKRHDFEHSLHCEVTVYFSPAAAGVARTFEARPCARPTRTNLDLLAGNVRSWAMLFS